MVKKGAPFRQDQTASSSTMQGFAIYEIDRNSHGYPYPIYAAFPHSWTCQGDTWVDSTPYQDGHEAVLLVETHDSATPTQLVDTHAKDTDAIWKPSTPAVPSQSLKMLNNSEAWSQLCEDPNFLEQVADLRSDDDLWSYLRDLKESGNEDRLMLIQTHARAFTAMLTELAAGPRRNNRGKHSRGTADEIGKVSADDYSRVAASSNSSGSYDMGELTSSVNPESTNTLTRSTKNARVREAELRASVAGLWRVCRGYKCKNGRTRLFLHLEVHEQDAVFARELVGEIDAGAHAGDVETGSDTLSVKFGSFQLESASWSSLYDETDVPQSFFAKLDEDDESAAQMRCSGVWEHTPYGFTLYVQNVDEEGRHTAKEALPLRSKEISTAAGCTRELYGTMDSSTCLVTLGVGERRDRKLFLEKTSSVAKALDGIGL